MWLMLSDAVDVLVKAGHDPQWAYQTVIDSTQGKIEGDGYTVECNGKAMFKVTVTGKH